MDTPNISNAQHKSLSLLLFGLKSPNPTVERDVNEKYMTDNT